MSCCLGHLSRILKGFSIVILEQLFRMPADKASQAIQRKTICRECDHHTWLSLMEMIAYLKKHQINQVKDLERLENLEPLPIREKEHDKDRLFCAVCKCWIPAKAAVKDENCPLKKWNC